MEYIWNSKTNCFDGYEPQYETKTDETTAEEAQVLTPCTERLYTRDEVDAYFAQCGNNKVLRSVDGLPTVVNRYTDNELVIITKTKRIAELKAKLNATDYQAIKYAEGKLAAEEYEPMGIQRELWREEIRQLEEEVG